MSKEILTPQILQVNASGIPQSWLNIEEAVIYYATDKVLFELGTPIVTYHGGINRTTNEQSKITTNSIIAVKGEKSRPMDFNSIPTLSNKSLFERDRHVCAYCGDVFHKSDLSRDHIVPICKNGQDTWNNVVTSCVSCNGKKGGKTLEQARMSLLYLPYTPDLYENFIFERGTRKILADQMEFLLSKVSNKSRLKKEWNN